MTQAEREAAEVQRMAARVIIQKLWADGELTGDPESYESFVREVFPIRTANVYKVGPASVRQNPETGRIEIQNAEGALWNPLEPHFEKGIRTVIAHPWVAE